MIYKGLSDTEQIDIKVFRLRGLEKRHLEMAVELSEINQLIPVKDSPELQLKKTNLEKWMSESEEKVKKLSSELTGQEISDSLTRLPKLSLSEE